MEPDQLHYYQLRYDSHNLQFLQNLLEPFQIHAFVAGYEKKKDGTPHIQAMILSEIILTQNDKVKIREKLKKNIVSELASDSKQRIPNSCSITTCKLPHALYKYCIKTGSYSEYKLTPEIKNYITSLPLSKKEDFQGKLSSYAKWLSTQWKTLYQQGETCLPSHKQYFYEGLIQFYISNEHSAPRRQALVTLALRHNVITVSDYLDLLNICILDPSY